MTFAISRIEPSPRIEPWRSGLHRVGEANSIAIPRRTATGRNSSPSSTLDTEQVCYAGDLQHPDHGRVLRVAAGLEAAVRRSQGEAGVPASRGGLDQRGGLPRAPAGQ